MSTEPDIPRPGRLRPSHIRWIVVGIVVLAGAVRFWGIAFGLPHTLCRPDESNVIAISMRISRHDLNPHFFNYPTLYMYFLKAIYSAFLHLGRIADHFTTNESFISYAAAHPAAPYLVDRSAVAILGTLTVLMLYRVGTRTLSRSTGVIAAVLLAVCYLHVRDSHFGVTDVPMTFLVITSLHLALRSIDALSSRTLLAAGILAGLATSTKYGAAPIVAAAFVAAWQVSQAGGSSLVRFLTNIGKVIGVFLASFLAGTPYAVLDFRHFMEDVNIEREHRQLGHGIELGLGWLYHLQISLPYGVGWLLLVAASLGGVLVIVRSTRKAVVILIFPIVYYAIAGNSRTVFVRYMVPVVPFLCLAAAVAIEVSASMVGRWWSPRLASGALAAGLVVLVSWPSIQAVVAFDRLLTVQDSRLMATKWIESTFPGGATIYQSGPIYGKVQLARNFIPWEYDDQRRSFRVGEIILNDVPDIIVIQTSDLRKYPSAPAILEPLLSRDYREVWRVVAVQSSPAKRIYDQQDAFFLPFSGFDGVERPGPNITVYSRSGR